MKFKVGDLVFVKDDLVPGIRYGEYWFEPSMEKFKYKLCEIVSVSTTDYLVGLADNPNEVYPFFTDEMLTGHLEIEFTKYLERIKYEFT